MINFTKVISAFKPISLMGLLACLSIYFYGTESRADVRGVLRIPLSHLFDKTNEKLKLISQFHRDLGPLSLEVQLANNPPFQVRSRQMSLDLSQVTLAADKSGKIELKSQFLSLSIGGLSVSSELVQVVNGSTFRIKINGTCELVNLKLNSFSADADFILDQSAFPEIVKVTHTNISPFSQTDQIESENVELVNCVGPTGFERILKEKIIFALNDPNLIKGPLQHGIEKHINNEFKKYILEPFVVADIQAKVDQLLDSNGESLDLLLNISSKNSYLDLPKLDISTVKRPTNGNESSGKDKSLPQLFMKREAVAILITEKIENTAVKEFKLKDIPFFKKLLNSRFLQFFLWPDLLKFKKSADFLVSFHKPEKVEVTQADGDSFKVRTLSYGALHAQRVNELQKYLDLSFTSVFDIKLKTINGSTEAIIENLRARYNYRFDDTYVSRYHPNKRISKQIVKWNTSFTFAGVELILE